MKIPTKLKIGGHIYKVELHKEGDVCEDAANCGTTNRVKGVIGINASNIRTEQEQTLFHEVFHVMNASIDHALLDSLSQQIYQVLRDNKLLK